MLKNFILGCTIFISLFGANALYAQSDNMEDDPIIAVYRWYNENDEDHIIVADGELSDGTLIQWKYAEKKLAFWAYLKPGENRIAVYRWFNPKLNDWISIAEDEYTDGEMIVKGYTDKSFQFYAPIRRCGEQCVPVYRWLNEDTDDWMLVADTEDTEGYCRSGWGHKTFSFYGLNRSYK